MDLHCVFISHSSIDGHTLIGSENKTEAHKYGKGLVRGRAVDGDERQKIITEHFIHIGKC